MTANEIRQSFFDFFKEQKHTIVPSASLLPQSPGLLFTNAGMNQFVPYFLGTEKAPYDPPRAADTQKCIRAGGKHNDLDDVGYDTYHHTMFEMLGNWSFGDYFKPEAIQWGWDLIVERWGFPAERLYATVYRPDKSLGDPSEFDQEAYELWAKLFESKGLDPKKHVVDGNKADNFWMMGDTGPCGPCSELHVDLTPNGDTDGKLVNMDSDLCIEIWNLVFIQYNAEADGSFRDLPSKHVDTGMGFERACSIYQGTNGFKDFSKKPTNYATDIFTPIFAKLEAISGKQYNDIYPESVDVDKSTLTAEMKEAVAFRVIADHIRTLSFSIADGILPGNTGRNYVLRRILRRAVRYGRTLGFTGAQPFLPQLVDVLVDQMQAVFPEMGSRREAIKETLTREEESFNRTLDRGLQLFENRGQFLAIQDALNRVGRSFDKAGISESEEALASYILGKDGEESVTLSLEELNAGAWQRYTKEPAVLSGDFAFELYDTYGFPIDLTELLCQERKLEIDMDCFERRMNEARTLSQASQKKTIVRALDISSEVLTAFTGYDEDSSEAKVLELHESEDALLLITDRSPFYVEMGGQLGDTGFVTVYQDGEFGDAIEVTTVQKIGQAVAHEVPAGSAIAVGDTVALTVDAKRRRRIETHHTATHLLHWALHEVVSQDATQQGSLVTTDRLRFDFTSSALSPEQIAEIELKVNEKIVENAGVFYNEVAHASVKDRKDIMQFFGDKYGDTVRVVQIGGSELGLDGYAMELCGGTHLDNTRDIGIFKIKSESAIASGVRRIEAACGVAVYDWAREIMEKNGQEEEELRVKLEKINAGLKAVAAEEVHYPLEAHIMSGMLTQAGDFELLNKTFNSSLKYTQGLRDAVTAADKKLKKAQAGAAAAMADAALVELLEKGGNIVAQFDGPANMLQELLNGLKKKQFNGAGFFIVNDGNRLHLGAFCGADALAAGLQAGKLIQELGPIAGGKGGGKPDQARGAAPELEKSNELQAAALAKLG
ncbi:alanine--tRNA ligase [Rubritalea marina]|uniref:alanine--tRNA ligase n=1 Tax=Rubritalea marina TaxID=361055 RepID=UPI00037A681C|nr:alanine--tRNA ligase-related protein [Rubritalea marina]